MLLQCGATVFLRFLPSTQLTCVTKDDHGCADMHLHDDALHSVSLCQTLECSADKCGSGVGAELGHCGHRGSSREQKAGHARQLRILVLLTGKIQDCRTSAVMPLSLFRTNAHILRLPFEL